MDILELTGCENMEHLKLCIVKSGYLFTDPKTAEEDYKEFMRLNNIKW